MHEYDAVPQDFAAFSVNAHNNASNNPNAMYHNKITPEAFVKAPMIADPIGLFDAAPAADGAAAVVLAPPSGRAHRTMDRFALRPQPWRLMP
jgi:acetyl-CoA C-acetyltransferase